MTSIFTKIMAGDLPGEIVYQDSHAAAFLDINPKAEGHTLVVPRVEVSSFEDLPLDALTGLMHAVQQTARAVTRAMGTPHYNLNLNNGAPAGQVIFHVHFHIIPRWAGVPRSRMPLGISKERMGEIGASIREAVSNLD